MKILAVTIVPPWPPDHGTRMRAWHLLQRLAATDEVTLVTWDEGATPEVRAMLERTFARVVLLPRSAPPLGGATRLARHARGLLGGLPPYVQLLTATSAPCPPLGRFDVAIAEDDAAAFLMPAAGCPRVVTRHNVFSKTVHELAATAGAGAAKRLVWAAERGMWRRFDARLAGIADHCIVTTPESADALRAITPGARVSLVTNGVVVPEEPLPPSDSPCVVFVGTMSYQPNADAVEWLVRESWGAVRDAVPGAALRIIGHDPLPSVRRLEGNGVRVLGTVPDVVAASRGARAGVVSLRAGSGIKNKTLELMAMGLPVVATSVGAEGIPIPEEDGLIVRSTAAEIAAELVRLLTRPDEARALGAAARAAVSGAFSWDAAADQLRGALTEALAGTHLHR